MEFNVIGEKGLGVDGPSMADEFTYIQFNCYSIAYILSFRRLNRRRRPLIR